MATQVQPPPYQQPPTYQVPHGGEQAYYVTQQQPQQQVVYVTAPPNGTAAYPVTGQPVHTNVVPQYQARPRNGCIQCGELYPLPQGAYSWRCRKCGHFNDLQPTCCTIL
eukprot:41308_1